MIERVDAVILAGGSGIEEGNPAKSMLPLGSRLMVDYVVDALKNCQSVENIVLVGPEELKSYYGPETRCLLALPGATLLESFMSGVDALETSSPWILVCTGDIPFLTTEAVDDYLAQCQKQDVDFYYPIIRKETAERRFPGVRRTYASLREGSFTGGNLLLIRREIIQRCLSTAEEFVRLRKNPAALARLVGFGMLWKYFLGQLTIAEAERRVSHLLGVRGTAVISGYPEIGVDVDKPSDLELARQLVGK